MYTQHFSLDKKIKIIAFTIYLIYVLALLNQLNHGIKNSVVSRIKPHLLWKSVLAGNAIGGVLNEMNYNSPFVSEGRKHF